jgi:hypothetical protein
VNSAKTLLGIVGVIIAPLGFGSLLFANPVVGGVVLTTGLMMVVISLTPTY